MVYSTRKTCDPITSSKKSDNKKINQKLSSKISQIVEFIWPVKRNELPKFLFLTLLMFCILAIQNLIRAIKDSIIITMIGAETISFLKFWGVMPAAFLITVIYVKLIGLMRPEKVFYLIISSFLLFFVFFAFYLFPNHQHIHLNANNINFLIEQYPHFKWFILLISNWSFSLFYIIAELWPNAVFALLFWQFVNKITSIEQSKRFYLLFGLFGQTGLIISGFFLQNLKKIDDYIISKFNLNTDYDVLSVQLVIFISLILGLTAIFSFWFINSKILQKNENSSLEFKIKKAKSQ